MQDCFQLLILGLIQGITEFLPISSTAHLKAIPMILGWGDPGVSIAAIIQLGSIFAVICYFREDLRQCKRGFLKLLKYKKANTKDSKLAAAILLGTLPIVVAGLFINFFWQTFEISFLRSIASIAIVSIIMGLLLFYAERKSNRNLSVKPFSIIDGLNIGIAQMFAIIPGVSRSGICLTAGLLKGWDKKESARFSFLLGIPAITLAGLLKLRDLFIDPIDIGLIPIIVGMISSIVFSWFSIHWLLKYLEKHGTGIFVMYRIIFGVSLLFYSWKLQ